MCSQAEYECRRAKHWYKPWPNDFYAVKTEGSCCWNVSSRTKFRGLTKKIESGVFETLEFYAKSVRRLITCD